MVKEYKVKLEYVISGLPYVEQISGAKLIAEKHENTYTLSGNASGLLFLAQNLIALAEMPTQPSNEGYHIHLDGLYDLNNTGVDFILRKDE